MRRLACLLLLLLLILPQNVVWSRSGAQQIAIDSQVEALLDDMGPEERIGQLSLVTFYGNDVSETSDIAELISRYHVGGVALLRENDNFGDSGALPRQVYQLTSALQTLAANPAQSAISPTPDRRDAPGPYIPLFIGLEYDGSDWPHAQLLSGVTPLPSSMAIGATWNPQLAEVTGQLVGDEYSALGINLLLGPSVDVVEDPPQTFSSGDLRTSVFGGETYWVSQMAKAFVRGVHEGSNNRLAVVPRHFPGHGGADRLASTEVPRVRKTLDELKLFDLPPFFAITDVSKDPLEIADALMTGHISYRGLQGDNPRADTDPISLDTRTLPELLKLGPLATWRDNGGLIVSDALGLRGVWRWDARQDEDFPGRQIAKKALMAGNDVLYLGQFGKDPPIDQKRTIVDTIDWFVEAYQTEPAFQARVDDAVRRILRRKLQLYGGRFDLRSTVVPNPAGLSQLGKGSDVTLSVAQNALTLLSPPKADLLTSPRSGERILVFTDTRSVSQCTACAPRSMMPVNALQSAILRQYGAQASKLVTPTDIQSYTFDQLANRLDSGQQVIVAEGENATAVPDTLSLALNTADWVVFLMLDVDSSVPSSNVVKRFLAASPVSPDTHIVVMAMDAPYYLDATEVGYLTAYYGLYGYSGPFIDVAARALFMDVPPFAGASPVSVGGVNYSIEDMTSPDPNQLIDLCAAQAAAQSDETCTPVQVLRKGDVIQVSTGIIVDRNGHPVPDGTPVDFELSYKSEGLTNSISSTTLDGRAQTPPQPLDRVGELSITASAGSIAVRSKSVDIVMSETGEASITVSSPDIPPTLTPIPTVTPTIAPVSPPEDRPSIPPIVNFGDLLVSLFGLAAISIAVFVIGLSRRDLNYGLLLALPPIVLGLVSYNYYALYMPGAKSWRGLIGDLWGAGVFTWIGALIGLALTTVVLYTLKRLPHRPSGKRGRH